MGGGSCPIYSKNRPKNPIFRIIFYFIKAINNLFCLLIIHQIFYFSSNRLTFCFKREGKISVVFSLCSRACPPPPFKNFQFRACWIEYITNIQTATKTCINFQDWVDIKVSHWILGNNWDNFHFFLRESLQPKDILDIYVVRV